MPNPVYINEIAIGEKVLHKASITLYDEILTSGITVGVLQMCTEKKSKEDSNCFKN